MIFLHILFILLPFFQSTVWSQENEGPIYVAPIANLNDFGRFADGGPDENWYVGFNSAWIVELPPAPIGDYTRAFIGAKLGRAKTQSKKSRPWERERIPGEIYMGISQAPAYSSERSFFLADVDDIPIDPDPRVYMPGAGESQWFWAEVPLGLINFSQPNYLAVWSPTPFFVDASSSPVLAAAESMRAAEGARAWANRSIRGVPPRKAAGALETPIGNLLPALAIKLVPRNRRTVSVEGCAAKRDGNHYLLSFSVTAKDAELAWLELSQDRLDWERASKYLRRPPYVLSLGLQRLPAGGAFVRAVAKDSLGNEGACEGIRLEPASP